MVAFVKAIEFDAKSVEQQHPTQTQCFVESGEVSGAIIVAISTIGSAGRVSQEHRSQTIQFGKTKARQIYDYLGRVYGFDR